MYQKNLDIHGIGGKEKCFMYDLIPPYGNFNDVLPGDLWQPEPAARYNAVNELLRRESMAVQPTAPAVNSHCLLQIFNPTENPFPPGSPVQTDTFFAPEGYGHIDRRNLHAYGRPVGDERAVWGVALEEIRPLHSGPVQMAGVALLKDIQGKYYNAIELRNGSELIESKNNFIYAGLDGKYHLAQWGRAEILWYDEWSRDAVVLLGGRRYPYSGMFAVTDNGNRTLTVKAGETDLSGYPAGMARIDDTVIPATVSGQDNYISLNASRLNGERYYWQLEVKHGDAPNAHYVPGEVMCWDLARYRGIDDSGHIYDLVQLWQGGPINFKDRYYAE